MITANDEFATEVEKLYKQEDKYEKEIETLKKTKEKVDQEYAKQKTVVKKMFAENLQNSAQLVTNKNIVLCFSNIYCQILGKYEKPSEKRDSFATGE